MNIPDFIELSINPQQEELILNHSQQTFLFTQINKPCNLQKIELTQIILNNPSELFQSNKLISLRLTNTTLFEPLNLTHLTNIESIFLENISQKITLPESQFLKEIHVHNCNILNINAIVHLKSLRKIELRQIVQSINFTQFSSNLEYLSLSYFDAKFSAKLPQGLKILKILCLQEHVVLDQVQEIEELVVIGCRMGYIGAFERLKMLTVEKSVIEVNLEHMPLIQQVQFLDSNIVYFENKLIVQEQFSNIQKVILEKESVLCQLSNRYLFKIGTQLNNQDKLNFLDVVQNQSFNFFSLNEFYRQSIYSLTLENVNFNDLDLNFFSNLVYLKISYSTIQGLVTKQDKQFDYMQIQQSNLNNLQIGNIKTLKVSHSNFNFTNCVSIKELNIQQSCNNSSFDIHQAQKIYLHNNFVFFNQDLSKTIKSIFISTDSELVLNLLKMEALTQIYIDGPNITFYNNSIQIQGITTESFILKNLTSVDTLQIFVNNVDLLQLDKLELNINLNARSIKKLQLSYCQNCNIQNVVMIQDLQVVYSHIQQLDINENCIELSISHSEIQKLSIKTQKLNSFTMKQNNIHIIEANLLTVSKFFSQDETIFSNKFIISDSADYFNNFFPFNDSNQFQRLSLYNISTSVDLSSLNTIEKLQITSCQFNINLPKCRKLTIASSVIKNKLDFSLQGTITQLILENNYITLGNKFSSNIECLTLNAIKNDEIDLSDSINLKQFIIQRSNTLIRTLPTTLQHLEISSNKLNQQLNLKSLVNCRKIIIIDSAIQLVNTNYLQNTIILTTNLQKFTIYPNQNLFIFNQCKQIQFSKGEILGSKICHQNIFLCEKWLQDNTEQMKNLLEQISNIAESIGYFMGQINQIE